MKEKKIPIRMCIVCHERLPKSELLRIVKAKNNSIIIDKIQKKEGRGCYLCSNPQCLGKFIKSRALNRAYRTNIPIEIYEKLKGEIEELERTKK